MCVSAGHHADVVGRRRRFETREGRRSDGLLPEAGPRSFARYGSRCDGECRTGGKTRKRRAARISPKCVGNDGPRGALLVRERRNKVKLLANLRLGKKIALATVGMVALLLCTFVLALFVIGRIKEAQESSHIQAARTSEAQEARAGIERVVLDLSVVLMHQGGTGKKCTACHEDKPRAALLATLNKDREAYEGVMQHMKDTSKTDDEKQLLGGVEKALATLKAADSKVLNEWNAGKLEDSWSDFKYGTAPALPDLTAAIQKLLDSRKAQLESVSASAAATVSSGRWALIVLLLVAIGVSAPGCIVIARDLTRPIAAIIKHLGDVSRGDVSKD